MGGKLAEKIECGPISLPKYWRGYKGHSKVVYTMGKEFSSEFFVVKPADTYVVLTVKAKYVVLNMEVPSWKDLQD